jgi:uncharacterized protein (TIRG00374 family)
MPAPHSSATGLLERPVDITRPYDERRPAFDENDGLRVIVRQVAQPRAIIASVVVLVLVYLVGRHALDISVGTALADVRHAHPAFLGLGLVVFYLVYFVRAARWQVLLANAGFSRANGQPMPSYWETVRLIVIAAFANSVTVAQLGDAYRAYLLKQKARVSFAATLGTILAERIVDVVVLVAMLEGAALEAFGRQLPSDARDILVIGVVLAVLGLAGLASLSHLRPLAERIIPDRWHDAYYRFEVGTTASLRRVPLLLAYSVVGWLIEGATIYLLALAVAAPVGPLGAIVAGLVSSLLSVEPVTPGGLGATETGIVLVLTALAVPPDTAAAVAMLNRLVNFLSLAVVGPLLHVAPSVVGAGRRSSWRG